MVFGWFQLWKLAVCVLCYCDRLQQFSLAIALGVLDTIYVTVNNSMWSERLLAIDVGFQCWLCFILWRREYQALQIAGRR